MDAVIDGRNLLDIALVARHLFFFFFTFFTFFTFFFVPCCALYYSFALDCAHKGTVRIEYVDNKKKEKKKKGLKESNSIACLHGYRLLLQ